MLRTITGKYFRAVRAVLFGGFVLCVSVGCATYRPVPLEQLSFRERAETLEDEDLRVSVSVLSREEARQAFGVNLQKRSIQPVWLEIENRGDKPFWFMLHGMDPNYFSAHEAAYMNHFFWGGSTNKEMDAYFADLGIDQNIEPGKTQSGFAFTNETIGTKEIRIRLFSHKDVRTFEFFISIPGIQSDWDRIDLKGLYAPDDMLVVESDEDLKKALQAMPCCTQRSDGSGEGKPVNIVLVGLLPALKAFIKAGWDETAFQATPFSYFGTNYLFGREPDVQFQKTTQQIQTESLVRLWVSPILYRDMGVWVGSIVRNIDPLVDEAAIYLVEDLGTARTVSHYGIVQRGDSTEFYEPRTDFMGRTYWTRGETFVLKMTEEPVTLDEIDQFDWDWVRNVRRIPDPLPETP